MSEPLVTFMLFSYNQEQFIREAVRGALAQTYSPLEIILSDDCSQDRTFEVIKEEVIGYDGPHKILVNRNEENLGVVRHLNSLMELASGQFIVIAAGDDISEPHRTTLLAEVWKSRGASGVCSNAIIIDSEGIGDRLFSSSKFSPSVRELNWQDMITGSGKGPPIFGAAMSWDRAVFDVFGPLPANTRNEDQIIPFRAALLEGVHFLNQALVYYREHGGNLSFWVKKKSCSSKEWLSLRKQEIQNTVANRENWIEALQVLADKDASQRKHFSEAIVVLNNRITLLEREERMLGERLMLRISDLLEVTKKKIGRGELRAKTWLKFLVIALSPEMYARVMQKRALSK